MQSLSIASVRPPVARTVVPAKQARRSLPVVRSTSEDAPSTSQAGTYFFRGNVYNSEEEWKKAIADGTVNIPAATTSTSDEGSIGEALPLTELMAFSGPAPELINGRLSMLAFVAALGAELSTGEGVLRQLADEPTGVLLTAITFATASLIPLLSTTKREAFGPFTPNAEMLNGRAAMIGFAALLLVEGARGGAALF